MSQDYYYEDFFRYAYFYGEEAARKVYKDWSPPEGTSNPYLSKNIDEIQPTRPQKQGMKRKVGLTTEGRNALTQAILSSMKDPQGKMDPTLLQKTKQITGLTEEAILKAGIMAREEKMAKRQDAERKSATQNPSGVNPKFAAVSPPTSEVASAAQSQDEPKKKLQIGSRQLRMDAVLSTDIEKEAFEEFMSWSLSDKADLNPKKFAKQASGVAKLLIAGEISIRNLLNKRRQTLNKIEVETKKFEYKECFEFLFSEMNFDSPEYEDEFKQHLKETLSKKGRVDYSKTPMHLVLYDSFQEVLSTWPNSSKVCLDDCFYVGASREEFNKLFSHILQAKVRYKVASGNELGMMNDELRQKYFLHPTARGEEHLGKGAVYAHNILNSVLLLYEESHRCWRCNRLHGKGNETKALICARCKCAVYCSKECQETHWKGGEEFSSSHKSLCEKGFDKLWSVYKSNMKRVDRALRKGRICTKPLIVNGIEKECFLRPCESFDYFLCKPSSDYIYNALRTPMDIFYENIATLACGGKHLLFGNETISSQLEERIQRSHENVLSEFDPGTLKEEEISAMERTAVMLQYSWTKCDFMGKKRSSLSVERFITLYICWERFHLGKHRVGENLDKFEIETNFLRDLKNSHW